MDAINTNVEAARVTAAATLVTIWGITLNEWAAIAAIAYTALQAILILPRVIQTVKGWFNVNPK